MILLPAIDLMSGEVVRLRQGKADQKTVYSRDPAAFAGKRVRVTVLPDRPARDAALAQSVGQWLAEGDALQVTPQASTSDAFTQLLVEKARKQGLLI